MNKKNKLVIIILLFLLVVSSISVFKNRYVSKETKVVPVEINGKVNIENANYINYVNEDNIIRDVTKLDKKYEKHFSKFIQYIAPNNKPITIIAQDQVSDEQLLKAYNILDFYLTNHKDYDMKKAANLMAENGALLMMPNGADGQSSISESILTGQPLYQMEVPVTGSDWYINNDYEHRDASYEEILHLVHDYGIGTSTNAGAMPYLQRTIKKAMENALPENKEDWGQKGLWGLGSASWLKELSREGSLEQEYIVSVVDTYYGLWQPYTDTDGGMWGIYIAKSREEVKVKDPNGLQAVESFLPKYFTYMDRISPKFEGTFHMQINEDIPYTYKSQYIINAQLTGSNNSNLIGNDKDNILIGNSGNNIIDGKDGVDIVQFSGSRDEYIIEKDKITDKLNRDGVDQLINIEMLRFTDQDILMLEN